MADVNIAIALAQFVMLALATMAAHILVNCGSVDANSTAWGDQVTIFISTHGLWFLLIPAVWLLLAVWLQKTKSPLAQLFPGIGAAIAVAILAVIVLVLAF